MRVIFFQVIASDHKLQTITDVAAKHFEKQEKLLFVTENAIAAQYIDELLWKRPINSFIPHALITEASNELIQISTIHKNVIESPFVFNLTSIAFSPDDS